MELSLFEHLPLAPPDIVLGTAIAYNVDSSPDKVNLGIGAYRTEEGKPYVFPVVRDAEASIFKQQFDKEYLPIDGLEVLKKPTQRLVFGSLCPAIDEGRIASTQVLSGTGGLRLAADFIKAHIPQSTAALISSPTWPNHLNIFKAAGFNSKLNINISGMLYDLDNAPDYSVVVLHTCAHNPTGLQRGIKTDTAKLRVDDQISSMDPTTKDWILLLEVIQRKKHIPLFDLAYQGYASGDLEADASPLRLFQKAGQELFVSQSFAKNMGLYSDRIGMLHVVCTNKEKAQAVLSQLLPIIRKAYSTPPAFGARIVSTILTDSVRYDQWVKELRDVANRVKAVRQQLRDGLTESKVPGSWDHITMQIGMFSYTGLTPEHCDILINKWHIYLLRSGRISLAGLNSKNLPYVINAIGDCIRTVGANVSRL